MRWRRNRIAVQYPPAEVTSVGTEVDPREVGVRPEAIDAIWGAVERLYATGTQPAIALCIRRRGQIVLDRTIGHSHGNAPGEEKAKKVLANVDTPFCVFSISKAITAMVIHLLDDRGLLHVDDRVAEYIPEFAQHGKEWVTIRHVLTHRAGIPSLTEHSDPELLYQPERIVQLLCEAHPTNVAGRRLAYHAITGGFILGEIVRRVTGKTIQEVLETEVLEPLNFQWMRFGVPRGTVKDVAQNAFTGPGPPAAVARVAKNALGVDFERVAEVANSAAFLTGIVPSGNIVSTADELSRFFQLLLDGGEQDGVRIFDRRTIRRAATETSYLELDLSVMLPVRYGVGLMLGGDWLSPFGPQTPRAFGHLGFINNHAWADPERQLSVALLTTGKAFLSSHLLALIRLLRRISHGFSRTETML